MFNMRKDNFRAVDEMRENLNRVGKLTLERFIMPDEERPYGDEQVLQHNSQREYADEEENPQQEISGIEKELTGIRKIALSVINRLADQPTSPQYDTMKKIWNMVDKAIEQPQKGNNNYQE